MDGIFTMDWRLLIFCYEHLAFVRVKSHEPVVFPLASCPSLSVEWPDPLVLILLYRRQSSANSRAVDETTDGKSLLKSRNKRGPKTVSWGTPEETVVAADDWPSSTTHCVRPSRKLVIQYIAKYVAFLFSDRCQRNNKLYRYVV
jgi:hypothetical protein